MFYFKCNVVFTLLLYDLIHGFYIFGATLQVVIVLSNLEINSNSSQIKEK